MMSLVIIFLVLLYGSLLTALAFYKYRIIKKLEDDFSNHLKDDSVMMPIIHDISKESKTLNDKLNSIISELEKKQ